MFEFLNTLPRFVKALTVFFTDIAFIPIALYAALVLRLNAPFPVEFIVRSIPLLLCLIIIYPFLHYGFQLYRIKLSGFDVTATTKTGLAVFVLGTLGFILNIGLQLGAPRTVPLIFMFTFVLAVLGNRLMAIYVIRFLLGRNGKQLPIAIFGAGQAGVQLILALKQSEEYRPVVLVDDNRSLHGLVIEGLKVSSPEELIRHSEKGHFKEVFLAIPSLTSPRRKQILGLLSKLNCKIRELPTFTAVIKSGNVLGSLRQITSNDVLGRDRVDLTSDNIRSILENKTVLVSGAGGSIGSEICRQVLANGAKSIILFEQSEIALYKIEAELCSNLDGSDIEVVPYLGSVTNAKTVHQIIAKHEVNVIYHAAAYKHVPIVESNEVEGVYNNVIGTKILAEAAVANKVERFTLVSSDKAVNPTNIMGATKRLAEYVVQNIQNQSLETVFSIVRFGNVLGSSGSVVPLFKQQIASGGPITLTHDNVTRYFMTIQEASSLVLLAGALAEGGEVFVLDMGKPIKIKDLAVRLVELSGFTIKDKNNPEGDIEIKVTGLRSGEKLYEELLITQDTLPTPNPKIFRAKETELTEVDMEEVMRCLEGAISARDSVAIRQCIVKWVEGYHQPTHE